MARRIDHLVLCVHDLDEAGGFYQRMGFQVGARNRHPWGTENRLVQMRSSFLELITVGEDAGTIPPHRSGQFSFGAFVRDYLRTGQGLAMLVLDSQDASADSQAFAKAGIGDFVPFSFERQARRPDGTQTHVGFTLAFATNDAAPDAGFFVCQQHFPGNFWNASFQRHDNGAMDVVDVTLSVPDIAAQHPFLTRFSGSAPQPAGTSRWPLDGGSITLQAQADTGPRFTRFTVAVPDVARVAKALRAAGIPVQPDGTGLTVRAADAYGVDLRFSPA